MTLLYIFAVIVSLIIYLISGDGKFNNFSDPTLQFIVRENGLLILQLHGLTFL